MSSRRARRLLLQRVAEDEEHVMDDRTSAAPDLPEVVSHEHWLAADA
ncbi:MAG: hypothetical protein R2713_07865 [Ilumatobacteraceae bacterium]|nr:hypothetical protein [Acidimicrobiales bacterium]MCB9395617.1 hypothetical protein [Acidimicrobiaceae bacterium]